MNTPQIWPGPLLASPSALSSLAGQRVGAGRVPSSRAKGRGLARMIRGGLPRPTNERNGFCSRCPRSGWHGKWTPPPPGRQPRLQATRIGRRTRERAGGVGASARGVSRGSEARRACSVPHLSGRGGRRGLLGLAGGEGGGALAQPPLTGAGSAAAAALSARALPEPGLACAAAPRRRRLLCSNGSSSGRHGQAQRGAHPRAARYEAAVVSRTPRPGASQTQCVPPRGSSPSPRAPCIPTPRQPPAPAS